MTKAIRVHKVGGPEALVYESVDVPAPGPGEVRIRQHAVGLNFIDVYYRTGLYKAPGLPFIAGNEASGEVVAVGPGVTNFHPGDRVAYYHNLGAYTGERNIPWEKLVKLPDHITYEQGAVLMLKGLTVWYLLHKTFKVEPHHRVLVHAAAGGIGLLACQWARALGAHVIGTVGSREKAELAEANGCDHVILYNEEDFVARVKQISRRSRSPSSTITARCSRRGRSSTIMSARARNCSKAPTPCSPRSSTASCTCRSTTPTHSRTLRKRISISKAARPRGLRS